MVGKTSLRQRFMGEGFKKQYLSTLGTDFSIQHYKNFRLQIWDLGGQDNFKRLIKSYIKGSKGIVLVFDVVKPDSLDNLESWLDLFIEVNDKLVPTVIVGNKIDLRHSEPEIVGINQALDYVKKLSEKYSISFRYIETSALTGVNINDAFESLADEIAETF
jgi:Ras-related protein Rab-1A